MAATHLFVEIEAARATRIVKYIYVLDRSNESEIPWWT